MVDLRLKIHMTTLRLLKFVYSYTQWRIQWEHRGQLTPPPRPGGWGHNFGVLKLKDWCRNRVLNFQYGFGLSTLGPPLIQIVYIFSQFTPPPFLKFEQKNDQKETKARGLGEMVAQRATIPLGYRPISKKTQFGKQFFIYLSKIKEEKQDIVL